ncbi:hypothetical protein D3C73_1050480 [compost metagenome]
MLVRTRKSKLVLANGSVAKKRNPEIPRRIIFSRSPNTAINMPSQKRESERILTKSFLIGTVPISTLDASIPRAIMVSSVPNTALSEKARIIGIASVSMKPRKKVITEVIITSTSTPLLIETALHPSLNSLMNDPVSSDFLEVRPLRTASVEATVTKKVQMSIISSSFTSETMSRNPASTGEIRYLAEPAT